MFRIWRFGPRFNVWILEVWTKFYCFESGGLEIGLILGFWRFGERFDVWTFEVGTNVYCFESGSLEIGLMFGFWWEE